MTSPSVGPSVDASVHDSRILDAAVDVVIVCVSLFECGGRELVVRPLPARP